MNNQQLLDAWLDARADQETALSIYCDLRHALGETHRRTRQAHAAWARSIHNSNRIADQIRAISPKPPFLTLG